MPNLDDLTDEETIEFGRKLLKTLKEAHRRGIHPMEVLDEQQGHTLSRSKGWPCVLVKWTDHEKGNNDAYAREHREEGQSHIGMKGVTVYATDDNMTFVRFKDGAEVWCDIDDLLID